jgi:thiol-disulfide isomerase/thioredoxin
LRTAQKPVVLLFTSPECGPCTDLLPEIGRWHEAHSEEFTISLVSHLSAEENRAKIAEHGLGNNVLLHRDWEVAVTYGTESDRRRPGGLAVSGSSLKRDRRIV